MSKRAQLLVVDLLKAKHVQQTHDLLYKHILRTREISGLDTSTAVLCFEANLGFEAQHLMHACTQRGLKRWVAMAEGAGGALGWLATADRKEAMCLQLREALTVGNIALSDGFFSCTSDTRVAINNIKDELSRFSAIVEPSKTLFGKTRKTFTGKISGLNDDLAICIQMALSALRIFYTAQKYSAFRPEV